MSVRHYLGVADLTQKETLVLLERAVKLKAKWNAGRRPSRKLRGCTLAAIYEKPSLRTRVSFEAGMTQLGGHAIYLGPDDIRLGHREIAADVARNLSRIVQVVAARTFLHTTITDLAAWSSIPVINALSDKEHPCQALADFQTITERFGTAEGRKIAYVGDGNNVVHSLLLMGGLLGTSVAVASPLGYQPDPVIMEQAQSLARRGDAKITLTTDPIEAVVGADVVYTDVWTSMGQESEHEARAGIFASYQVTAELLQATGKAESIFMHCLPAHRGEEVTDQVLDSPQSVVFDQAENRLHAQKALILFLLGK